MINSICNYEEKGGNRTYAGKPCGISPLEDQTISSSLSIVYNPVPDFVSSAALGSFNHDYLISSTMDFSVTLLHYLLHCFLRYFHICILLGFFFANEASNANKIISSHFLFQLNDMIFTLSFSFHLLLAFYVRPFIACLCCGSWVQ